MYLVYTFDNDLVLRLITECCDSRIFKTTRDNYCKSLKWLWLLISSCLRYTPSPEIEICSARGRRGLPPPPPPSPTNVFLTLCANELNNVSVCAIIAYILIWSTWNHNRKVKQILYHTPQTIDFRNQRKSPDAYIGMAAHPPIAASRTLAIDGRTARIRKRTIHYNRTRCS